jgi:YVTN family beta-propeller protein
MALALILFTSYFRHASSAVAIAQSVPPSGAVSELAIDDGVAECVLGAPAPLRGTPGFGWVNKLTPASYPATLRAITIGFNRNGPVGRAVARDALYRIVVYLDPEKDGPGDGQPPDAAFIGRVRDDFQSVMTFNLVTPLTIQSGSFVVGAIDEFGIADFAALYDVPGKSTPPGSESFVTFNNGGAWQKLSDAPFQGTSFCDHPGSFLIRATVESGAVDALTVTKITDPLAVEPWGVSAGAGIALVTNYGSDNLTVIKIADNTFQNVPLGDGPGGDPDGPFGVIGPVAVASGGAVQSRAYVTLFGSNTIPTKEFPVDYSTVGPGRVVVLTQSAGGLTPALTINVGKGPRFPAIVTSAGVGKIYVPCGGANRVDVIDTGRNEKVAEIPVGLDPSSCVASINGAKIYVTNFGDGSVSVIDTKTDKKIKDIPAPRVLIPAPVGSTAPPASPLLTNPWNAAVSQANGNVYVTYWGTEGNVFPNGAIAEFDTCEDEFVRATLDSTTRGTPPGSAGASGIEAPAAPLALDPATGMTPGAGGGGGGPFGIASCVADPLVFTNDALGIVGLLDARIDQVVSAPPVALASCPKPRGVSCANITPIAQPTGPQPMGRAFVACGQPDNSVLAFNVPKITQNISGLPVIESVKLGSKVELKGAGFAPGTRLEFIPAGSLACLSFERDPKVKKQGKLLQQKGSLTDGTKPKDRSGFLRVISPDGSITLIDVRPLVAAPAN